MFIVFYEFLFIIKICIKLSYLELDLSLSYWLKFKDLSIFKSFIITDQV